jgi:hypothetical protein
MGFGNFLGGTDNSAQKEQQKANARTQQFIQEQAALARGDAGNLYAGGDYARNQGINAAMGLMGQSMPTQMGMFQDGNVSAQMQLLAGLPQYQNAILGMPVNNGAMQPTRLAMPDASSYQQQLPDFGQISQGKAAPAGSMQWQQPQPQPMQQQQMDPQQMMQMANTYNQVAPMFGGQPLWGGAASGATGSAPIAAGAGQASATGAVQGAGAAGGSSGSMMASAGPWAALAAAIIANESKQQGDGNRGNSKSEWFGDAASGKVLERDMDRYLAHNKAGGAVKRAGMMTTPSGTVRNTKDFASWLGGLF